MADSRYPNADGRPANTDKPRPSPQPTDDELRAVTELLLYPSLRARLTELSTFASAPLLPILEALVGSDDPAHEILARHGVGPRWVKAAEKALGVVAASPADDDANQQERLQKTFADVLRNFERRNLDRRKQAIDVAIQEAEARGESAEGLKIERRDLTLRQRELKPRD